MSEAFLSVRDISKSFGGVRAVNHVSFDVGRGEVISIIGPNGAGKTTLFNLLTGQFRPDGGEIRFNDVVINRLAPNRRARLGLGRTFQIVKPLAGLTVLENAMVGAFLHASALHDVEQQAHAVLAQVGLADRAAKRPGELTLSEQRRLEVARALATRPQLLLLDEVMAGLNQRETIGMIDMVHGLNEAGLTLLIIEHNLKVLHRFSNRVIVLDRGAKLAEGGAQTVLGMPEVVVAYLGKRQR